MNHYKGPKNWTFSLYQVIVQNSHSLQPFHDCVQQFLHGVLTAKENQEQCAIGKDVGSSSNGAARNLLPCNRTRVAMCWCSTIFARVTRALSSATAG